MIHIRTAARSTRPKVILYKLYKIVLLGIVSLHCRVLGLLSDVEREAKCGSDTNTSEYQAAYYESSTDFNTHYFYYYFRK